MTSKKQVSGKIICVGCTKEKVESNYYANGNPLFKTEKTLLCKNCLNDYIGDKKMSGHLDRVIMVLSILNKPFLMDLWESKESDWGGYIRQLSSLPQYKGMTFKDSDFMSNLRSACNSSFSKGSDEIIEITLGELSNEALKRWRGFALEDAMILEDFYQELILNYEHGTPIQRNLYKNMAITQMKADKAVATGNHKEYKDLMDTLSKLMNDANIKPVQETGAENSGISSFGEFIKMIEETEPIPEPRDEFKDVDGIKKYVDKWFVHHFSRVFGLSNDSMEEYDRKLAENGDSEWQE